MTTRYTEQCASMILFATFDIIDFVISDLKISHTVRTFDAYPYVSLSLITNDGLIFAALGFKAT